MRQVRGSEIPPETARATQATWDGVWASGVGTPGLTEDVEHEEKTDRWRQIRQYLEDHGVRPPFRAVELGSGSGIYGTLMARIGAKVTLVDMSEAALGRAHARAQACGLRVETVVSEATRFARAARGQFDLAMSFGTVEHFPGESRFLMCRAHSETVRVGGVVVLSVPNLLFLPHEALKWVMIRRGKWALGYEESFSPWGLRRMARRIGLSSIVSHGTDTVADYGRHWRILKGTRTWRRLFASCGPIDSRYPRIGGARLPLGLDGLLAQDITVMGVKV